jgi:hypothetical protein
MKICRPLEAATLTALQVNTCPCSIFPTLYFKSDITVYVSLAVVQQGVPVTLVTLLPVTTFLYYFSETTATNHYWKCWKYRGNKTTGCNLYNNR